MTFLILYIHVRYVVLQNSKTCLRNFKVSKYLLISYSEWIMVRWANWVIFLEDVTLKFLRQGVTFILLYVHFFPSYILEKLATYSCEVQQKTLMCNSRPRDENEALAYKKLMQSSKRPPIYYINRILYEKEKKKQKQQTFFRQTVK